MQLTPFYKLRERGKVGLEIQERKNNKIQKLLRQARFPFKKTLVEFDFEQTPNIQKQVIVELCRGGFLSEAKNIILLGPPGVGKTHLSLAIGRELCLNAKQVLFITACELVQKLGYEKNQLTLSPYLKRLNRFDLIIIDELGFIPFEKTESELLFQFFSARYEQRSVLITTNLVFSEWEKIFQDHTTTSAVIDRLIHHCVVFEVGGESYRSKSAKKNLEKYAN